MTLYLYCMKCASSFSARAWHHGLTSYIFVNLLKCPILRHSAELPLHGHYYRTYIAWSNSSALRLPIQPLLQFIVLTVYVSAIVLVTLCVKPWTCLVVCRGICRVTWERVTRYIGLGHHNSGSNRPRKQVLAYFNNLIRTDLFRLSFLKKQQIMLFQPAWCMCDLN